MGIQVHTTLVKQRAYALGQFRKLARTGATTDELEKQNRLVEAYDLVIANQGIDVEYDRDFSVEPRPRRHRFPRGAYTRDVLTILRRQQRPMSVAALLDSLCEMHNVTLSPEDRAHAAIKLAQGNWTLIQKGFVVRVDKAADHRSAACLYSLKQFASMPETVNE